MLYERLVIKIQFENDKIKIVLYLFEKDFFESSPDVADHVQGGLL